MSPARGRTLVRTGARVLGLGVVLVAWAQLLRPVSLGGPVDYLVIRGDSMLPTYRTGDLVIVREAQAYGPGDIVAYRVPAGELGAGRLVIHRIVADSPSGFVIQGDNNPAPDPWQPTPRDVVGRAWVVIPGIGRVLSTLRQPAVLAAGAVTLLVVGWFLHGGRPKEGSGATRPTRRNRRLGTLARWTSAPPPQPIASSSSAADSGA